MGPLAEGQRHRDHGRADAARLAAGVRARRRRATTIRRGRWVAEADWPSQRARSDPAASTAAGLTIHRRVTTHGARALDPADGRVDAGSWLPYGNPADLPGDQRQDDARSLCFDSRAARAEPLEVLGQPRVRARAREPTARGASSPCGSATCAPDGTSTLITRGVLNLSHRRQPRASRAARARQPADVDGPAQGDRLPRPAGHRLRVAISTSYWPWLWPSPKPVTITVHSGPRPSSCFPCGRRRPRTGADPFGRAGDLAAAPQRDPARAAAARRISRDVASGRHLRHVAVAWAPGVCPTESSTGDDDPCSFRDHRRRPAVGLGAVRAHARDQAGRVANAHRDDRRHEFDLDRAGDVGHARGVRGRRSRLRQGVRRDGAP